jgi:hypothetical protein
MKQKSKRAGLLDGFNGRRNCCMGRNGKSANARALPPVRPVQAEGVAALPLQHLLLAQAPRLLLPEPKPWQGFV